MAAFKGCLKLVKKGAKKPKKFQAGYFERVQISISQYMFYHYINPI